MVRGIPWDQLPNRYEAKKVVVKKVEEADAEPHKFDFAKDSVEVARRAAFGAITGSITGACFGLVEVLRDPGAMSGKKATGTKKVLRFTYLFAGFFGTYHAARKVLQMAVPQDKLTNIVTAATLTISPLLAVGSLRPLIPYSVMLVAIDAFNELSSD
uniref:Mitochondrial import inner membrane translocase subunit TIM22 n=1 Tax=Spumella elongata TaxID=89044 RepID=A0A7S3HI91_9STRA|mmetsp:Transcript_54227/g.94560  ORF Transcript_54227/g.94560 Transcript_54227/m.94560 type:complete len:157 (+) Transcript_54227:24-494(+)|eukprot:CAMPEP_0184992290 /NCGR_PEP_ID=MMETSP1098-20130426/40646_1 /TAXON_ID=89044 /ORGANISM="Spumella elongata, Strain CCAP 955/1" /LENGTH=156 /DNA_ID=CAMNT_0027517871 /DNA_START=23 /DNA_END=493 /DNA_ORIENTATION=+